MRRALLVLAVALCAPAPAAASAGGGDVPTYGGAGATSAGNPWTYVTVPAGPGHSVVEAIHKPDGAVQLFRTLPGEYGTPVVAVDGSTTGLSGDGATLVLAKWPAARTDLLVLYAQGLQTRTRVSLPGSYSVDAVSPDGRWIYLIHYLNATYEVRAYDLLEHRLAKPPVVDPREPDEPMSGQPLTRVVSADGRWAYTLYSAKQPFVHALDTVNRRAVCIDLDGVPESYVTQSATLTLDGSTLKVANLADVDVRTYKVSKPAPPPAPRYRATPAPVRHDGGSAWPFVAAGIAVLAVIGLLLRRRSVPDVADLHVAVHHADEESSVRK